MTNVPSRKRVIAFIDGQNLFHGLKEAFGAQYPDFDPLLLARETCAKMPDWDLVQCRLYTGLHGEQENWFWHHYWVSKLQQVGSRGVATITRPLRYQRKAVKVPGGSPVMATIGTEKGIDVRIALDCIRMALDDACDVILLFSQDQDLAEVVTEVRRISMVQNRWIKVASAYPQGRKKGVMNTDWLPFDNDFYQRCLDPRDHRPEREGERVAAD